MILAGLLIGGGATYLGTQISQRYNKQWNNKQEPEYGQRLVDKLSIFDDPQIAEAPLERRMPVGLIVSTGMVVAGGFLWWASASGMTPLLLTNRLIALLRNSSYGQPLYLAAYTVGPLFLFPASLLTVAGGLVFGPIRGIALAIIGSGASALVAYGVGRRLRLLREEAKARHENTGHTAHRFTRIANPTADPTVSRAASYAANQKEQDEYRGKIPHWKSLQPYLDQMRARPFFTVATMHLLFLPFDLVNYGAGVLAMDWRPFLLGTVVGSLPATLFLAQAGASIPGGIITGVPQLSSAPLVVSGLIFVGSIAVARRFNHRQRNLSNRSDADMPIAITANLAELSLGS